MYEFLVFGVARFILVLFLFFGFRRYYCGMKSISWPAVSGVIMSGKSSLLVNPSAINSQIPEIEYRYMVEGNQYKSSRINFSLNQSSASAKAVDVILRKYRSGNVVKVYYDPVNPKESVLETGMNNVHFTITMVLGVVCLGGIGFANIIF